MNAEFMQPATNATQAADFLTRMTASMPPNAGVYRRWSASMLCPVVVAAAMSLAGCPQTGSDAEILGSGATPAEVGGDAGGGSSAGQPGQPPQDPQDSSTDDPAGSAGTGGSAGGGAGQGSGGGGDSSVAFVDGPTLAAIPTNQTVPVLPAGSLRIVTVGDSLTEGIGDESAAAGGFPRRLLEALPQSRAGSTVLNLGKSGWTSTEVIEGQGDQPNQIDAAVAAQPHIACLWIGCNDMFQLYEYGPFEGTPRELEAANLATFAANIETTLSRLKATGAALYVAIHDDQSLRPVLDDRATLPYTTATERAQMSNQVIRFNNVLIAAAQRHSATVIDFYHTTIFTSAETLDFDGIHPNAAGYDRIAGLWYAAMAPAVTR